MHFPLVARVWGWFETHMIRVAPDFSFESAAAARGFSCIVGVDEVGRGPLAGPVTAAAVRLCPDAIPVGLADSKTISAKRRVGLYEQIMACADVGIGHASVAEIDAHNILQASFLAMRRAIAALPTPPDHLLIDGNRLPPLLTCPAQMVVRGDARCLSIAAASIIAKVTRDRIMADLDRQFPGYNWAQNAGYPTLAHQSALRALGVTPFHRRSFAPVRNILCEEN